MPRLESTGAMPRDQNVGDMSGPMPWKEEEHDEEGGRAYLSVPVDQRGRASTKVKKGTHREPIEEVRSRHAVGPKRGF